MLATAKEHKIPVYFECENGECGSCAVQVTVLGRNLPLAMHRTEKEKTVLTLAGKISKQQIGGAELNDVPPPWRLVCQYIVRDEDIIVRF